MGLEMHGVQEFVAVLTVATEEVMPGLEKVLGKGGNNMKRDAGRIIRDVSKKGYLPHYPYALTYDLTRSGDSVNLVFGPDAVLPQGVLARVLEYGTVNNAPIPHVGPAFEAEVPRTLKAAGDLAVDLLEGAKPRG